jgi:hypothetical protein
VIVAVERLPRASSRRRGHDPACARPSWDRRLAAKDLLAVRGYRTTWGVRRRRSLQALLLVRDDARYPGRSYIGGLTSALACPAWGVIDEPT